MLASINKRNLLLSITPPQHKHEIFSLIAQLSNDRIGKNLPAHVSVRSCFMSSHGKHRIQRKYTLPHPPIQIARSGNRLAQIIMYLLKHIKQRAGNSHPLGYRKTNTIIKCPGGKTCARPYSLRTKETNRSK